MRRLNSTAYTVRGGWLGPTDEPVLCVAQRRGRMWAESVHACAVVHVFACPVWAEMLLLCVRCGVCVLSAGKRNKRSVRLDSRFCPSHDSRANTCCYQYLFIYPHKRKLTICVDTSVGPHKHTGLDYRHRAVKFVAVKLHNVSIFSTKKLYILCIKRFQTLYTNQA